MRVYRSGHDAPKRGWRDLDDLMNARATRSNLDTVGGNGSSLVFFYKAIQSRHQSREIQGSHWAGVRSRSALRRILPRRPNLADPLPKVTT